MAGRVLLLRGVNAGKGRTRVAMPWLRERCTDLGLTDVGRRVRRGTGRRGFCASSPPATGARPWRWPSRCPS